MGFGEQRFMYLFISGKTVSPCGFRTTVKNPDQIIIQIIL